MSRYAVYTKHRRYKRATRGGFYTDDFERAKDTADRAMQSWWGKAGVYEWAKVKDMESGKFVYTAGEEM